MICRGSLRVWRWVLFDRRVLVVVWGTSAYAETALSFSLCNLKFGLEYLLALGSML
jgi:hypothetical protein